MKKYIFYLREFLAILFLLLSIFININELTTFLLALGGYIIISYDIIFNGIKNIIKGKLLDENFLMLIASIGAFYIREYTEALLVIMLYQFGEYFQSYAVNKSRKSIKDLLDIRPNYANLLINDEFIEVDPYEVNINDIILIKPGERVPLDSIVIEGNSYLDTKSLTGETKLKEVGIDDELLSGSINSNGIIKAKVIKKYEDSTVETILKLVEDATDNKTKTENFITKFAKYYTPIVVLLALIIAIIPPLIINDFTFNESINIACQFLVISCPCALVISVPLSFFCGIGRLSKLNILIKGSNYIEILSKVKDVYFDKTGTLTVGNFKVSNYTNYDTLKYAAYGEYYSNHPLANAVKNEYKDIIDSSIINDYKELAGFGISYKFNNDLIYVGNEKLMHKENIKIIEHNDLGTIIYVAKNNINIGYILIEDEIKEDSYKVIEDLHKLNIETSLLSGDNLYICQNVSNKLNIDNTYGELLPQDKLEIISKSSLKKAFVGDGINDTPSLIKADVGISMGSIGSDAAVEASDVVIVDDNISKVSKAIYISKKIMNIVYQNIIFALGLKFIVMLLALFGYSNMILAIFADVGVSLLAILNAMRSFKIKI